MNGGLKFQKAADTGLKKTAVKLEGLSAMAFIENFLRRFRYVRNLEAHNASLNKSWVYWAQQCMDARREVITLTDLINAQKEE